jgi:hypothetical protein
MMTATNRLSQAAELPGFSSPDANELERIDGGDKCIIVLNTETRSGVGVCRNDQGQWYPVVFKY